MTTVQVSQTTIYTGRGHVMLGTTQYPLFYTDLVQPQPTRVTDPDLRLD